LQKLKIAKYEIAYIRKFMLTYKTFLIFLLQQIISFSFIGV